MERSVRHPSRQEPTAVRSVLGSASLTGLREWKLRLGVVMRLVESALLTLGRPVPVPEPRRGEDAQRRPGVKPKRGAGEYSAQFRVRDPSNLQFLPRRRFLGSDPTRLILSRMDDPSPISARIPPFAGSGGACSSDRRPLSGAACGVPNPTRRPPKHCPAFRVCCRCLPPTTDCRTMDGRRRRMPPSPISVSGGPTPSGEAPQGG